MMRVIVLHHVPSLKFVGFPFGRYGAFYVSALIDLETFDLSTYKWGHGSPVPWTDFMLISACYAVLVSTLGQERDRQTDRQTDNGHQCLMPLMGTAHNKECAIRSKES